MKREFGSVLWGVRVFTIWTTGTNYSEPRFNEPLYVEVQYKTNNILRPNDSKIEKESDKTSPRYVEQTCMSALDPRYIEFLMPSFLTELFFFNVNR